MALETSRDVFMDGHDISTGKHMDQLTMRDSVRYMGTWNGYIEDWGIRKWGMDR